MPIHTELKADFNGVQNPYPLTPSDAFVSSIRNSTNQNTDVDWSNDLSSWNGDTGELSVVQREVPTRNGTRTTDFIKGYPVSAPVDGTDFGKIYDTNDTVNFDFTSSSDNPSIIMGVERESLLGQQGILFEIESNRTNSGQSPVASDRYIRVGLLIDTVSETIGMNLQVKNTDSNTVTDTIPIPRGFFDTVDIGSSGAISLRFDNSTQDTVTVNVTDLGSGNSIGTLSADVSTNGLPSNPNTLVSYYAQGINHQRVS